MGPWGKIPHVRDPEVLSGAYCHTYNRGVDKRLIFLDAQDYERFLAYLYLLNGTEFRNPANHLRDKSFDFRKVPKESLGEPLAAIGAFCLMPNHFHILAKSLVPGGLSKLMQRVETAYTMYFNRKYGRSGCLLQGNFKAKVVRSDGYLRAVFSYIHRNPIAHLGPEIDDITVLETATTFPYSSASAYFYNRHTITAPERFPRYYETPDAFRCSILVSRLNLTQLSEV